MRMKRDNYAERNNMDYERNSGPPSGGYGGRPLSRSRSMMDVRHESDSMRNGNGSMRRSISSNNIDNFNNFEPSTRAAKSAYAMDDMYESASRPGSVMSERRRVSPTQDWDISRKYQSGNHPSSVSSFPVQQSHDDNFDTRRRQSTSNLRRSMSQPNLARTSSRQSVRTYPQGILKKPPLSDDGRAMSHTTNSSDSGIKDLYGETPLSTAAFDRRVSFYEL